MLISFVLPVYNNAGSILRSCRAIRELFGERLRGQHYQIVLVDDGSRDGSYAEMRTAKEQDGNITLVRFTRNFGQVPAILAGFRHAIGDAVINMSADLQDPVELTAEMIQHWLSGSDVVIAYRSQREDSVLARFFSWIAYGALRLSNREIPRGGFDFVLMSRRALASYCSYRGRNRFFQGDVLWAGFKTTYIPYVRRRREVGRSQYTFGKKLKLFIDFVIDGTYLPIRLISMTGVLTALCGAIYALVIVVAWFLGSTPFAGWAPLMVVTLLVGGVIMLMLGIIGEYLWRILDEVKGKPDYVIDSADQLTGGQSGDAPWP